MESKKRPHADDGEHSRAKKRAVSDDRASPSHPNGTAVSHGDEPKEGDNIELFRKEAIFRRMKHYSREAERSQARVADLERRFSTCRAGLAALEVCWTQLIGTIRSLARPEDLPSFPTESEGISKLADRLAPGAEPAYVESLQNKLHDTLEIVQEFVALSSQSHTGPSNEDLLKQCHEAEAERSALRGELLHVGARLRDAEAKAERYHEQLLAVEKRVDRLQSKTLTPNHITMKEESLRSPSIENGGSSPAPPPIVNGNHSAESDEWLDLANLREAKIEELVRENGDLRVRLHEAQLQLKIPSEELVTNSSHYQVLLERASRLEYASQEAQMEASKLKEQLDNLTASRSEVESNMKASHEAAINELKVMLSRRDSESARLREQRDQYQAEINERRTRESAKFASILEFKVLAENRAERIAVLESENKRLKTRLAAQASDEDLLKFIWQSTVESPSYVEDLKQRLHVAEERAAALEKTLASLQGNHTDIAKNEAETRRQLAKVQKQLERYQAIYGDASTMSADATHLSEQLQRKQEELDKLALQDQQRELAESALYAEIDKLSAAWEGLDRQVKNKVFDLSNLEERVTKLTTERAKSENKFYQCMRDKDALDSERKRLSMNLEKATKAIDKLTESEKSLTLRVADLEKELGLYKKLADKQRERGSALEADLADWQTRARLELRNAEEMKATFQEQTRNLNEKREELRKLEESLLKSKKDAEKQAAKLKSVSVISDPTAKETQVQKDLAKCMELLKCSTCQINMRNTVITKCMHTFCKQCVDARISTRQRKCPACNLAFSGGEVNTLYFQ
ncbi:BRE1-domain-containing protein [Dichomitus squalens LYAD-421 SS1]|uniref:BRE1-domain-containing protein n=1 Tax=Dichomitus squalens (strain LYAD-421) TaxID=732165 RepID=UPI0004416231|nr:BRE1-domain-containing protein [Dichomitus squalens LYAD-421 SS1]EJF65375.1 BRE1-domain-containing protein [Dichomitus squalens LYAD-421 SS1]